MASSENRVLLDRGDGTQVVVHLFGATVLSWKCQGQEMLFLSKNAVFDNKKAIRGGIPVVFPQFGPWDLGPQHGFARIKLWTLEKTPTKTENGDVVASLSLEDDNATRAMWNDNRFKLVLELCLQETALKMSLVVTNKGPASFSFTTLLHTYLGTPDVTKTEIRGLGGLKYVDKVRDGKTFTEDRDVVVVGENYDRVYQNAPSQIQVSGAGSGQNDITLHSNFPDIVVWNPWAEKAKGMSDFGDDEYPSMLCVEAGAVSNPVSIPAATSQTFSQVLTVSRL